MSGNLHGNAPDSSPTALLLIDVINDLEFEGGDALLPVALAAAERLAALAERARRDGVPVIYVNDNFGRWRSDFAEQVRHCLKDDVRGKPVAQLLEPRPTDYFVLKPKHSGFYATPLHVLLQHLGAERLVLGGLTTDNCVMFTASDAFLRDFRLEIVRDGVCALTREAHELALRHMETVLKAKVLLSHEIAWCRP